MNTLIIPCAGKSNRFPNMKPKWMLTHPDGELMVEKAMSGLNVEVFDRIIITIVKPHAEKYEADVILSQVFKENKKVEICILDDFTESASETVFLTLEKMSVEGSFVVKDSDNCVFAKIPQSINNFVVGYDLHKHPEISNIPGKSFLIVNKQHIIQDIIEKKVVSNIICLGVYAFENVELFKNGYKKLLENKVNGEMFISHVISYLLSGANTVFTHEEACGYEDWGTLAEWNEVQKNFRTYFVDVDGVLIKNSGKYGAVNWSNNQEFLHDNIAAIKSLQDKGAQIVVTTSRTEEYKESLMQMLNEYGIKPYAMLMGMNHAARVVINDFAPTNPYPSAMAVTLPRNHAIKDYLG